MARARNIKPGFFTNDKLAECQPLARLLFQGLWCHADREGRIEDRPKKFKAEILPYDDCDTEKLLQELESQGFVIRYSHGEKRYLQVVNFCKHQNPHVKEQASEIPAPCKHGASTVQAPDMHSSCPADSLNLIPDSIENTFVASDADDASAGKEKTIDSCPHQEIISLYAEILPELPQPRIWDGARAKSLTARWRWVLADLKSKGKPAERENGLDFFRRMFCYIRDSDFLMGRAGRWSADLGWIVKAEPFAKILQGNYENKQESA
ncbi:MAG: hypothetical protein KGP14_00890 [Betaproteobacteria bacterium]|nr:hypothetical protein [Betaproteobacteria bacterium]